MRTLLLLLSSILFSHVLASHEAPLEEHVKKPLSIALPLLEPLEPLAIEVGHGPVKVYAFIDPLCPHSRNFIDLVSSSEKMQDNYHYYFFLYTLPRLLSEKMVVTIYGSSTIKEDLLKVMVEHQEIPLRPSSDAISQKVAAIAKVASELDVYKRPYLILVKPKKAQP